MIFNTYWFFIALLPFLLIYWAVPSSILRMVTLLIFCAIFHTHFAGAAGVKPIIVLALVSYGCALSRNKHLIALAISFCVMALCFYKYLFFVSDELIGALNPELGKSFKLIFTSVLPAAPPLAISFFTFEFVHYLYEVKKGGEPIKNPLHFALFSIFFPSLVAGPIKRYTQFIPSLEEAVKKVNWRMGTLGLVLVCIGFFKKLCLADNLTSYTEYFANKFELIPLEERWFYLVALSFRIYLDFSGYSDIAIGLARMMGITLPTNFNWPYLALNMREFWHRWHISLSSWIRDYVYIPLGGNRHGMLRTAFNGAFAFALCGLWHGAHWHYMAWGLYHGIGISLCLAYPKLLGTAGLKLQSFLAKYWLVKWLMTYLFVSFGWLLFFFPLPEAVEKFQLLFTTGYQL